MSKDQNPTKQRIINATIQCIEEQGLNAVTIRSIARIADVNIAAINYYFGSKENLLEIALKQTMDEAFLDTEAMLGDPKTDPFKVLKSFLENTLCISLNTPGITKAHIFNIIFGADTDKASFLRLKEFVKILQSRFAANSDADSRKQMSYMIVQILSAVFMVGLIPQLIQQSTQLDFHDKLTQEEYISFILKNNLTGL